MTEQEEHARAVFDSYRQKVRAAEMTAGDNILQMVLMVNFDADYRLCGELIHRAKQEAGIAYMDYLRDYFAQTPPPYRL